MRALEPIPPPPTGEHGVRMTEPTYIDEQELARRTTIARNTLRVKLPPRRRSLLASTGRATCGR